MLLENRVLWCGVASTHDSGIALRSIIEHATNIESLGRIGSPKEKNIEALRCQLKTSVQYTHDVNLLEKCAISARGGLYAFEFMCAAINTPNQRYYCFLVPFRRMLGGVLRPISRALGGQNCRWHRLEIMTTVERFRAGNGEKRNPTSPASLLCGLDLHLMAGRGEQEIVFIGLNPAKSRVFDAVTDSSEDFTLSPISATFCVGQNTRDGAETMSYFTIDRGGVLNARVTSPTVSLSHLRDLLIDFEQLGTLAESADRPVYKSRNSQKKAILRSISA